ncbi:3 (2),5 -bisphosphate nucleotidase [Lecanosticta acicola]|uniref:3 (2 ),5 -bisphosphate nucleotidase n=1 Tax=Lecanosticta acicola TaxID=111012 RepID=A0AAI9E9A2_9PEZI|nr:3 (2),5 -bisphosphate nucleotidase [Lecanosticta acicola]
MTRKLQKELEIACTAVQHCAVLTQRLQRETVGQDSQIKKSDFSPVSIGDFACQALLTAATQSAFRGDKYLAEESADDLRQNASLLDQVWQLIQDVKPAFASSNLAVPASRQEVCDLIDRGGKNQKSDEGRTWVFDPIDGTQTFLRGQQYALNCAFMIDGKEEIGIIGCPNLQVDSDTVSEDDVDHNGMGLMIFAVRGEGTWMRPMQSGGTLLPATRLERHGDTATLDKLVWSDCSTYTSTILHLHQQVAAKLNTPWPGVDLFSSLMKYAALGLGRCHIVMRIFKYASWRSNMWDHAGGVLIFEEAGGKVTDLNGKPIDFTQGRKMAENYGLLCAPSSVHAEVLQSIHETLQAYEKSQGPIPWSK